MASNKQKFRKGTLILDTHIYTHGLIDIRHTDTYTYYEMLYFIFYLYKFLKYFKLNRGKMSSVFENPITQH